MGKKILVVNPGSTSTKIAMYEDEARLWDAEAGHSLEELSQFHEILDQVDMRYGLVEKAVKERGYDFSCLDAVMSRGGPFARVESGAYEVGEAMLEKMRTDPIDQHASNTGMEIAYRIAQQEGIKAYIYDAITVDEMIPVTQIVGMNGMRRRGQGHNLNMRAAALELCSQQGWDYGEKALVICHLGGGITLSLHQNGRIVDIISDDEGPFSPERAGGLPNYQVIDYCFEEGMTKKEAKRRLQRAGGFISLLGTSDSREIERRVGAGDKEAGLVTEAMALAVAKNIAKLSVVTCGNIDAIILTGGMARWKGFTDMVEGRVSFIAPVHILPGENEMEELALGGLRVLRGEEEAKQYRP
ncbi:MAG: butyrate kinase [Clostridiales bacterium]|nr:butyrate kinase [Clostridiales bacterium]